MHNKGYTIWCNIDFSPTQDSEREILIRGIGAHRLLLFERNDGSAGESRKGLETSEIAAGSPHAETTSQCENLLWIHLDTAGYTSFDRSSIKQSLTQRGAALTNSSAVYEEPCAQHLLAMMMSLARRLPLSLDVQRSDHSWPMQARRSEVRLLNGQTVLILGFGAIARRLVELLRPLGMNLMAVRREITGDEPILVVQTSAVDEWLPRADHIINILPANADTNNFLNAERLAHLKHGAIVYNIGRGTTLDQNALLNGLRSGRIAAAYLDVTLPEPLPADHPLWETPNCFITPHLAGGHDREKERQVLHFLDNLRRFEKGDVLLNRVW